MFFLQSRRLIEERKSSLRDKEQGPEVPALGGIFDRFRKEKKCLKLWCSLAASSFDRIYGAQTYRIDTDRFHRPLALLPRDAECAEGELFSKYFDRINKTYRIFFIFSPIKKID